MRATFETVLPGSKVSLIIDSFPLPTTVVGARVPSTLQSRLAGIVPRSRQVGPECLKCFEEEWGVETKVQP